jgi:septal ring factor EnvC (AmiA/AmiB activator)
MVMWVKIKAWLKERWVAVVGALAALFFLLGQKPRWEKSKLKEIKERDREIQEIRDEREKLGEKADELESSLSDFDKVVKEQDEKIAAAGKVEKPDPLTDPSDIASFIKERSGRK